MGLIVTEIYDALKEAGATEEKARAAAAAVPLTEHLATREDLVATGQQLADRTGGLGVELRQEIADLRSAVKEDLAGLRTELKEDIANLRAELKQNLADLRTEVDGKIADVRTELKGDIANLRAELKGDIARLDKRIAVLNLGVFSFGPAILALLVKLAFFP